MVKFSKRQWLTLIVISIADFCNAICVSLQAPFYPQEVSSQNNFISLSRKQNQQITQYI